MRFGLTDIFSGKRRRFRREDGFEGLPDSNPNASQAPDMIRRTFGQVAIRLSML